MQRFGRFATVSAFARIVTGRSIWAKLQDSMVLSWSMKRLGNVLRHVSVVLFLALAAGFLLGTSSAGLEVWRNDWLYYGLTDIVTREFLRAWAIWVKGAIALACAALVLRQLILVSNKDAKKANQYFSLLSSSAVSAVLTVYWLFQTNRYAYKSLWQGENAKSILGLKVPAALVSIELLSINLGIVVVGMAAAFVLHKILRTFLLQLGNLIRKLASHSLWLLAGCIAFVLSLGVAMPSHYLESSHPNVILISIDTLRADHLGCYGYSYETSPSIDALARRGVVFENTFAQSNWTVPSHMSIMTSQIASSHGVRSFSHRLPKFKVTLAEVMANGGYATAAFTGGYNVDARYGFDQGFDVYHGDKPRYLTFQEKVRYGKGVRLSTLLPDILDWMSDNKHKPFFMFLHSYDTHAPYLPHDEYIGEFSSDYEGDILMVTHALVTELHKNPNNASAEDRRRINALYDNEIRHVDAVLGRLFRHLETLGLIDRSIIILSSDHGDELLEHGFGHGLFLYDPEIRIPLIISYPPAIKGGMRVTSIARSIDIMPTILNLTQIKVPQKVRREIQGRSLFPLTSEPESEVAALSEAKIGVSIRTLRHKYILEKSKDGARTAGRLYDLIDDPAELTDIAGVETGVTKDMQQLLSSLLRALPPVRFSGVTEEVPLTDDVLDQLKALGYVQ